MDGNQTKKSSLKHFSDFYSSDDSSWNDVDSNAAFVAAAVGAANAAGEIRL